MVSGAFCSWTDRLLASIISANHVYTIYVYNCIARQIRVYNIYAYNGIARQIRVYNIHVYVYNFIARQV